VRLLPRFSRCPFYILEVLVAGPLDLAFLKRLPADVCVRKSCGVPQLHTLNTPAWRFLNEMLILNADPTITASELF
jgi:hypothetical protein